jgi:hypothetical protein
LTPTACGGAPGSYGDRAVHAEGESEGDVRVEADSRAPYIGPRGEQRGRARQWRGRNGRPLLILSGELRVGRFWCEEEVEAARVGGSALTMV